MLCELDVDLHYKLPQDLQLQMQYRFISLLHKLSVSLYVNCDVADKAVLSCKIMLKLYKFLLIIFVNTV